MPLDAIDMSTVRHQVETAVAHRRPFLVSTANLHFLITSLSDREFRDSLILSDLCTADGVAVVFLARLLGIPVKRRIAGADFLDSFRSEGGNRPPLKLFLFGGAEGVAAAAAKTINARSPKVRCVGWYYPGFGSTLELSDDEILEKINTSRADFLLASLGAQKGQSWLICNHAKLLIPVRAHLGAALNFEAGVLKRAPVLFQRYGLEWLWRIKEEPYLWRRYWHDGRMLLSVMITRVLPLLFWRCWSGLTSRISQEKFVVTQEDSNAAVVVKLAGPATKAHSAEIVAAFRRAFQMHLPVVVDLAKVSNVDPRFMGLVLVLRKIASVSGRELSFGGWSRRSRRMFRLNGLGGMVPRDD
jgi:N-acetylglucosaminyldiphosphoundecaprenol N-acetyl-beta-D-mannosaminyltransferase